MLISRRGFVAALGTTAVSVLLPEEACATTVRALDLGELVRRSSRATIGTPVHHSSDWAWVAGGRRIVTWTRVVQEDDYLHDDKTEDEILVMTLGGRVGKLRQKVSGEAALTLGKKSLIFASPESRDGVRRIVGMAQGHYPIDEEGQLLRSSSQLPQMLRGARRGGSAPSKAAVDLLSGKPLGDARKLIQGAR